jgi:hypothetical protein
MTESDPDSPPVRPGAIVAHAPETAVFSPPATVPLTPEGAAALEAAQELARKSAAPATPRAYKADWTHFFGLVRGERLCRGAGRARGRWRLARQPRGDPRALEHPTAAVGARKNASL